MLWTWGVQRTIKPYRLRTFILLNLLKNEKNLYYSFKRKQRTNIY